MAPTKLILASLLLAGAAMAADDGPKPTNDLERKAYPFAKFVGEALDKLNVIAVCNLRSNEWANRLRMGLILGLQQQGETLNAKAADREAFYQYHWSLEKWAFSHGREVNLVNDDIGATCRAMFNSSAMRTLDDLDRTLTGDYH
jgi:hypothetical protein